MDIIDKHCKVCKKAISVLYPTRWAYKQYDGKNHVKAWYCSWKCLREDEKKHSKPKKEKYKKITEGVDELANIKHRDPAEVVRGMFEAMDSGEEPRAYLRKIGYKNPTDQLSHLRCWASKNDRAALARLNKIPRMQGSGRRAKVSARKIPKAGESLLKFEHKGEPIAKVESVEETDDGGVVVKARKLPPGARTPKNVKPMKPGEKPPVPKPLDGGEWEEAPRVTGVNDDVARQAKAAEKLCVDIKEIMFQQPERLRISGLESRAIEKASWVRTGGQIVLNCGEEMTMILTPEKWRGLAKEIELMLEQFGA